MDTSGLHARLPFLISHISLKIDEQKGNIINLYWKGKNVEFVFRIKLTQLLAQRCGSGSNCDGWRRFQGRHPKRRAVMPAHSPVRVTLLQVM
jgi:hypothetical protein